MQHTWRATDDEDDEDENDEDTDDEDDQKEEEADDTVLLDDAPFDEGALEAALLGGVREDDELSGSGTPQSSEHVAAFPNKPKESVLSKSPPVHTSAHCELADDAAADDGDAGGEDGFVGGDEGLAGGEEGLAGGEEGFVGRDDDDSPEPGWQMYVVPQRPQCVPAQHEPNAVTQLS